MNAPEPLLEQVEGGGVEVDLVGREMTRPRSTIAPTPEEIKKRIDAIGEALREVIVDAKRLPHKRGMEPHLDPTRALAISQSHLQTGFMWLRRTVEPTQGF